MTARCISGAARWARSGREWLCRQGADAVAGARAFGHGVRFVIRMLVDAAPRLAAAMALLTVVQAALPVLNVRLTQMIVNALASRQAASALFLPLGIYLALHLTAAGLAPTAGIVQALVNERLMGQVNLLLLARVNALTDLSRFEDPALADELHMIGERAPHLPRNLLRALMILAQSLLSAIGTCLLLASLHPLIPLVLLGATLPALFAQRGNLMLTWNVQREMAALERQEHYWLEVGTGAGAAREVQLLGIAAWVRDQFARCLEELERLRGQLRRRLLWRTLAAVALRFSGTTAVFVALAARGVAGQLRPGDFVLFLGSLVLLDGSLAFLPLWIGRVIDDARVADRFLAFLEPDEPRPGERVPLPAGALRRGLEVEHLSFRYAGREESVLRDVSFRIQPGETVALVGRNGAGKTTLVKLLTALYRPTGGHIRFDGRDIVEYDLTSLRARVAVVFQDHGRYCLTAGENIGLGCVDAIADRQRIVRAANDGGSEAFIQRLKQGYETQLGKEFGGTQLSGGQWQTLALSLLLARLHPLLPLLLLGSALPRFRYERRLQHNLWSGLSGRSPHWRWMSYCARVLFSAEFAKEVRLFGLGDFFLTRYRQTFERAHDELVRLRRHEQRGTTLYGLLDACVTGGAYAGIALAAARGRLTLGDMALFTTAAFQLGGALGGLVRYHGALTAHRLTLGTLHGLLDRPPMLGAPTPSEAKPLAGIGSTVVPPRAPELELRDVWFSYPNSASPVLRGICLRMAPGEKIAIVGENGAGKTTLLSLIARLYDPTGGEILADGTSLRALDVREWRARLASVSQEFLRLEAPLRTNLALASLDRMADDRALWSACEQVGLGGAAHALPNRLDQMLGRQFEGGVERSGGEWQKVALARALLRDGASIVLLDEPTSALDAPTEHAIFRQFVELAGNRTAILVSHRFSTVHMADRILVLESGRVLEEGTHAALVAGGGKYAELFQMQAERYR